jgi:predicted nucleic acid-binding protein
MAATTSFQALVDSNAFIARLSPEDPFHPFAKQAFQSAKQQFRQLVTTNLVVGETLTVLDHFV